MTLLDGNLVVFIIFAVAMETFAVWTGLLPLWSLIFFVMIMVIIMYIEIKQKGVMF